MSYTRTFKIPYMLCDRYQNLSLRNLANLLADTSLTHSHILEKDIDMSKFRWIVYSWDIEIIDVIKEFDEVEVTTNVVGTHKFYAHRNVYIKRDGEIIVKAYGLFLLIDIERMRPVKMSKELIEAYGNDPLIYEKEDLTYEDSFNKYKNIEIRYTDIDSNFHVNNAVYFDYISDLCSLSTKDIKFINIVYKNEIRNKETIIGEYSEDNKEVDYRLRSTEDKTIYTYGKIRKNV